jgi:hypothetical protein
MEGKAIIDNKLEQVILIGCSTGRGCRLESVRRILTTTITLTVADWLCYPVTYAGRSFLNVLG